MEDRARQWQRRRRHRDRSLRLALPCVRRRKFLVEPSRGERNDFVRASERGMSRAFVKEDVDLPERSGRKRSASGLPPGATNYITARGAQRIRDALAQARAANDSARVAELEQTLASVHVVDPPDAPSNSVAFGATVTLDIHGTVETRTVVGVDELDFERDAVSWISPLGKNLLAADAGDRVTLEDGRVGKITSIEYRSA